MSTLVENLLLVLILLVVYAYRPQPTNGVTGSLQRMPGDDHPQEGVVRHATRDLSPPPPPARSVSSHPNPPSNEDTVFRASTPPALPAASPVHYRVSVKAEPLVEADASFTVLRVFSTPVPAEPEHSATTRETRSRSGIPHSRQMSTPVRIPDDPPPTRFASHPLHLGGKNVLASSGLMTPPASSRRATSVTQSVFVQAEQKPTFPSVLSLPRVLFTLDEADEDSVLSASSSSPAASSSTSLPTSISSASSPALPSSPASPAGPAEIKNVKPTTSKKARSSMQPANVLGGDSLTLKRCQRAFRNLSGVLTADGVEPVGTYWYKTESNTEILSPPKFAADSPLGIRVGDVFCHASPTSHQLWIRAVDDSTGIPCWQSVSLGHRRDDGRKLGLTQGQNNPTWLK